jgi:hypothetical protein
MLESPSAVVARILPALSFRAIDIHKANRNEVVEAIQQSSFGTAEFSREEGDHAISVRHEPSGSEMVVNFGEMEWRWSVTWTVGTDPMEHRMIDRLGDATREWLTDLKTDLETPDLFAELGREPGITALGEGQENIRFSSQEQTEIANWITDVKQQAKETYELPEEQMQLLEAKLDYLCEAAAHSRRIDWLNLSIGALGGAFAGGVLTPAVVDKVLNALVAGLGPIFGHPVSLLGP